MNIIDRIQQKTRSEYVEYLKANLTRLSGMIQQKPLKYFILGIVIGVVLVVFSKMTFPLLLMGLCAGLTVYFIAPEKRI